MPGMARQGSGPLPTGAPGDTPDKETPPPDAQNNASAPPEGEAPPPAGQRQNASAPPLRQSRGRGPFPGGEVPSSVGRKQSAAAPKEGPLQALFSSLLKKESASGESLSHLGQGLRDAIASASEPAARLLDTFGIGGEELIILLVMALVFREKGETSLLLALGYLLL